MQRPVSPSGRPPVPHRRRPTSPNPESQNETDRVIVPVQYGLQPPASSRDGSSSEEEVELQLGGKRDSSERWSSTSSSRSPSPQPPPRVVQVLPKYVSVVPVNNEDEEGEVGSSINSSSMKRRSLAVPSDSVPGGAGGGTLRRRSMSHSPTPRIVITDSDADLDARGEIATTIMASPRPKSPKPATPKKEDGNESFWDKIGTLGRKKKIKEVQEVQQEGKVAIDSSGAPMSVTVPPDDYLLDDNEERSMIEPKSYEEPKLKELIGILVEWINDELASHRIIVKNIEEDLYDGMVLHKLIEKLTGITLDVPEVTQSEEGQKQKLRIVLNASNHILGLNRYGPHKWSVESIHSKNLVAILHLLVALARHFRAPIRMPENVIINVVIVQKRDGQLNHRIIREEVTGTYDDLGLRCERDAFDTLFDHAPDKLQVVKRSLVTFVNKQLNKINLEVMDLENEFSDGVYLCLLMGLLEGYFVPLHHFFLTPQTFDEKLHNVTQAFELMMDAGLPRPKARAEDIVNTDLKSTLRVLYNLFTRYKTTN